MEINKNKPLKIEAYRCLKCGENLCNVSYKFAAGHTKVPIVKIPKGIVIKLDKYFHMKPRLCIVSGRGHFKINNNHSVEQRCFWIDPSSYDEKGKPHNYKLNIDYWHNKSDIFNSKWMIERLRVGEDEKYYPYCLLTKEEFNDFMFNLTHFKKVYNFESDARFDSLYKQILNLSNLRNLKRTTPGLEKLIK